MNLFIQIVTPFLGALVGSMIALSKFKKERMWQEKYNAYQDIINSIEIMNLWAKDTQCSVAMLPTIGNHDDRERYKEYAQARRQISKYACIGKLLISDSARNKLEKLESEIWDEMSRAEDENPGDPQKQEFAYGEHAQKTHDIIKKYLPGIIVLAKVDLK